MCGDSGADPGFLDRGSNLQKGVRFVNYTRFFVRKIGYINFVPKSVRRPSVRPSVRASVCPSVTFLVIVSSPKPLDVATSNFVGA